MSNRKETARRDARTAGKTATKNTNGGSAQGAANGNGLWHETTRKGERVLIDPAGRIYHGTAQEVRGAALTPWRRKSLAQSLQAAHYLRRSDAIDMAEFCEMCADRRRHAIMGGAHDESKSIRIPADVFIRLCAGARLVGFDSMADYFADLWSEEIRALTDIAENVTGKRDIPLTRRERAALDRLRAERKSA